MTHCYNSNIISLGSYDNCRMGIIETNKKTAHKGKTI